MSPRPLEASAGRRNGARHGSWLGFQLCRTEWATSRRNHFPPYIACRWDRVVLRSSGTMNIVGKCHVQQSRPRSLGALQLWKEARGRARGREKLEQPTKPGQRLCSASSCGSGLCHALCVHPLTVLGSLSSSLPDEETEARGTSNFAKLHWKTSLTLVKLEFESRFPGH